MPNKTKVKRDKILSFIHEMKIGADEATLIKLNEMESFIRTKKFGLVFEEHEEDVDIQLRENVPVFSEREGYIIKADERKPLNFLIEGDNLQALYLLQKTHYRRIDCIYIDPPFNTKNKDWKYSNNYVDPEDSFKHSKWLSKMKPRLLLAKKLLSDEGVLIIAIDDYEYANLKVFLDEEFRNFDISTVIIKHHPQGGAADNVTRVHEYAIFICPKGVKSLKGSKIEDVEESWSCMRGGTEVRNLRVGRPNSFYAVYVDQQTKSVVGVGPRLSPTDNYDVNQAPDGCFALYPIGKDGTERVWRYTRESMIEHINSGDIFCTPKNSLKVRKNKPVKYKQISSLWTEERYNAGTYGTELLKTLFDGNARFPYPKSLYTVFDCIKSVVQDKKDAIILDFFAGSGTTGHAVELLNRIDGGTRRFILVTNNEVSEREEASFRAQGLTPDDEVWKSNGISRYVTWPRLDAMISGLNSNGEELPGSYLENDCQGDQILLKSGLKTNVKYLITSWIPRFPQDYLLSDKLTRHVKEMIELENGIFVDNEKYVLIFNKREFLNILSDPSKVEKIENLWLNSKVLLNSTEKKMLTGLKYSIIPERYFEFEIKEAGEDV